MSDDQEVCFGVIPGDAASGWCRVLQQEGLPHVVTEGPKCAVTVSSGTIPDWVLPYVREGGVLVVDNFAGLRDLLPPPICAAINQVYLSRASMPVAAPCLAKLFPGRGWGEVRVHEDRVTKDGIEQDIYPLFLRERIGRGSIIFSGIPLSGLIEATGDRLRRFSVFSSVTERVSSVDKAHIIDAMICMLREALSAIDLPYVRLSRFPNGAPSVFIFRVDVDGVFGDRGERLAYASAQAGIRASFFVNGSRSEAAPGNVRNWPGDHELGQHGYVHNVFDTVGDNLQNLREGSRWMEQHIGTRPQSFVAPRGLWNRELDLALAKAGYEYSSDFALDFDSLPFRTPSGVLQVPVHPYSPERAAAYAEECHQPAPTSSEVRDHYLRVLRAHIEARRPVHVYGHPEVLGQHAEVVVPALAAAAGAARIPNMTLAEYARWWAQREQVRLRLWRRDSDVRGSLTVRIEAAKTGDESWIVESEGPGVSVLNGDGQMAVGPASRVEGIACR